MFDEKEPDLLKNIILLLTRTGGEVSPYVQALTFHITVLNDSNTEDEISSRRELCEYLLSKMFLDKMEFYPAMPFTCKIDEYSDWPVLPVPSEVFKKKKEDNQDDIKILWFYPSLKVGDILDCRVSEVLSHEYKLQIMRRYGVPRLLDGLGLKVCLKIEENELKILTKELLVCELVRVAVCKIGSVNNVVPDVYVTVDYKMLPASSNFRSMPKLGKITQADMPSYCNDDRDINKFSTYFEYLCKPQLRTPHFFDDLIEGCGIDPKTVGSFFPEYNRSFEGRTGQVVLHQSKKVDAKTLAKKCVGRQQCDQYDDALKLLEDAIQICPKGDSLLGTLYKMKSEVYSKLMKTSHNMKSLCDLEMAFRFAPAETEIKQKLLHQIFKVANSWYRQKQFKKAVLGFEFIVKQDKNHHLAARALDRIKTKHADQLLNLEEMSQMDLIVKKKELLTELKKMKTL